ncbi:MAG: glycosyltransferase [Myxococcales bacterium]|nr:glycosyltransferase [Myxococcales bacterium]
MAKFRIVDVNDFFSLTGGGVRRYHLEKLRFMAKRDDIEYHLLLPSDRAGVEVFGHARVHHVPALSLFGSGYRLMINPLAVRRTLRGIRPDLVEVGSPYNTPDWVRFALWGQQVPVVGFWHANFPATDVGRMLRKRAQWLGAWGEALAWGWARRTYGQMAATLAATRCMVEQLHSHGIGKVIYSPLGVDTQMFHPKHRDKKLRAQWGATDGDVVMAYAGRLSDEKNYQPLLQAYEHIRQTTELQPILVVAGNGPGAQLVRQFAQRYPQVKFLGFIDQPREMARILASVDAVASLSPYETFGLAAVEALASGAALVGSTQMSIGELLATTRSGIALPVVDRDTVAAAWLELLRPGRAALLGARGHQECLHRYSWKATFSRQVQVYQEVIADALDAQLAPRLAGSRLAGLLASESDEEAPSSRPGRRSEQS